MKLGLSRGSYFGNVVFFVAEITRKKKKHVIADIKLNVSIENKTIQQESDLSISSENEEALDKLLKVIL